MQKGNIATLEQILDNLMIKKILMEKEYINSQMVILNMDNLKITKKNYIALAKLFKKMVQCLKDR